MSQDLVIEGRILQIFPVVTGEGKNGTWERQAFLIEVPGRFPTKVHIEVWGERRSMLDAHKEGDTVSVWIEVNSREYNSRWYTSVRAWKMQAAGDSSSAGNAQTQISMGVPANAATAEPFDYKEEEDDIPF